METICRELEMLTSIPAVSGHEDTIVCEIYKKIKPLADEISIDRLGNLVGVFKGKFSEQPPLLVFAHVDEIGLIIRKIEDNGFLRFERIGGIPEKTLPGQLVDVFSVDGKASVTGLVGATSHHVTPNERKFAVPSRLDMYIDIGLSSKEEVMNKGIDVGSIVTYHHNFTRISDYMITSKALDNRIGVYLLLKLAEHLKSVPPIMNTYIVFSVQEEFNVRGVLPVFEKYRPHVAVCLDITPACDTPDLNMIYNIELGKGPAITQMNFHGRGTLGGLIPNPKLRRFIELTAKEMKIPFQKEVIVGVITDDAFTQISGREGVAMAHISIPLRYTHSPVESADLRDIQAGLELLKEFIRRYDSLDLERSFL